MLLKRLVREHPLGTFGAAILLVLILVSIFADVLAPFRFGEMNLDDRLADPSSQHPLGTDQLGRDFLSRLIHGASLSLFVLASASRRSRRNSQLPGGRKGPGTHGTPTPSTPSLAPPLFPRYVPT